jgi:predicted Zn-dependent protease
MRKTSRSTLTAGAGLLLVVLAGCTEVGITGRKQLSFVPESYVVSTSLQEYDKIISTSKKSPDAQATAMVQRVGAKIVQAVADYSKAQNQKDPFADYKWEFNLIVDPNVNAFAMPGGKVVVYTGLLPVSQTESGLATVLGHEIAHVYANHGKERMSHELLAQAGEKGLDYVLDKESEQTKSLIKSAYGMGTNVAVLLPYDRKQESEADHLGLVFMAMAGYDPQEAVNFWQRMAAATSQSQQSTFSAFTSTHPTNEKRITDLKGLLPEAQGYYHPAGAPAQKPPAGPTKPPAVK